MSKWWDTPAVALGFLVIGIGAGAVLAYIYPPIGIPVCILLILVGIWLIVRAYKKRNINKDNPIPPSNRDQLLRAIMEARMATIELTKTFEAHKKWQKDHPNLIDVDIMNVIDKAQKRYSLACESLEKEILVAGSKYEPILKPLYLFMQSSAILNASPKENGRTLLTFKFKLDDMVIKIRNNIDGNA